MVVVVWWVWWSRNLTDLRSEPLTYHRPYIHIHIYQLFTYSKWTRSVLCCVVWVHRIGSCFHRLRSLSMNAWRSCWKSPPIMSREWVKAVSRVQRSLLQDWLTSAAVNTSESEPQTQRCQTNGTYAGKIINNVIYFFFIWSKTNFI